MEVYDNKSKYKVGREVYLSKARVSNETGVPLWFLNNYIRDIRTYTCVYDTSNKNWVGNVFFDKCCYQLKDVKEIKERWKEHRKRVDNKVSYAGRELYFKYKRMAIKQKRYLMTYIER